MKIVDEKMLDLFRGEGRCELCGKTCKVREPHHVLARGMGGGRRLDIRLNLIALGSTRNYECQCHSNVDSERGLCRSLAAIAKRENVPVNDISDVWFFILRLDKDATPEQITAKLCVWDVDPSTREMARKALQEAGKL